MNLVIVESPSKAKTIGKYLGKEYKVIATVGHIIDLPKNKLGVDVEDGNYEPEFTTIKGKASVIKKIKDEVKKAKKVYLAMDPDREGEAIAWHTAQVLKLDDPKRVLFYEITKDAVKTAIEKPRRIDDHLVKAQIARRVLDRLVGYKVSELLWKKVWYGLSAGRVQSVALRLIVEREIEIENFVPTEFWDLAAHLKSLGAGSDILAKLTNVNGKKAVIPDKDRAEYIEKDLKDAEFALSEIKTRHVKKHAPPPFTTSTLQQAANNILGFSAKRTMGIAQALYQAGFITYMRTDSFNLSDQALEGARSSIKSGFGEKYLPESPNFYKTKSKGAQEAHEAIRPTSFDTKSEEIEKQLGSAEAKLYKLIYNRVLASQMTQRESEVITAVVEAFGESGDKYRFTIGGEKILFDGYQSIWGAKEAKDNENLQLISNLKEGDRYSMTKMDKVQNFTKPKPRYTDASLVKALELHGVGRPSTYATIISTVVDRGYVRKEGRNLIPLDVGRVVSGLLGSSFKRLVDYEYTAGVEKKLDDISEGEVKYEPFIDEEYKQLVKEIDKAHKEVEKEDVVILGDSEEKCDKCGSGMVVRVGRSGRFLSCNRFPDCKGMKGIDGGEEALDPKKYMRPEECPKCGSKLILKTSKYGKFWACEKYPECKGTVPLLLVEKCPECDKPLVERRSKWGKEFIGCSGYPDCRYIKKVSKKAEEAEEAEEGENETENSEEA